MVFFLSLEENELRHRINIHFIHICISIMQRGKSDFSVSLEEIDRHKNVKNVMWRYIKKVI